MLREPSPTAALEFEQELARLVRGLGRAAAEFAYNHIEPAEAEQLPQHVQHEATAYRRLNRKTPQRHVSTLFGKITLWRHGYRDVQREASEPTIFPLEIQLGLVQGATPALAGEAARALAETGASQQVVLERLREKHGVEWGVKKLRAVTEKLSATMEPRRRAQQAARLVSWLDQAAASKGNRRPVLAVGRDGITLATRPHGFFEVATTATLTVYDRRGRRLGSVYLAYAPQLGQQMMTDELTALIDETLRRWEGPTPQLVYVTDAGENETKYYRQVLRKMRHPRTGQRLSWQWIVDYYHAHLRLTAMGQALLGPGREASAWARRMGKLLLQPNGPFRVLHAAAALRHRRGLPARARADFRRAYQYLKSRTGHMQYAEFRRCRLPIGSGVTEAACKTVFTQRLKLSGMRWSTSGAQVILNLRVILLSGLWDGVYEATMRSYTLVGGRTPQPLPAPPQQKAA